MTARYRKRAVAAGRGGGSFLAAFGFCAEFVHGYDTPLDIETVIASAVPVNGVRRIGKHRWSRK